MSTQERNKISRENTSRTEGNNDMDHRTWINMNSRKTAGNKGHEECVKTVTLDQVTITVSNAEQQLNTDTWNDELNADS